MLFLVEFRLRLLIFDLVGQRDVQLCLRCNEVQACRADVEVDLAGLFYLG